MITDSEAYAVYAAALQQRLTQGGTRVERITLLGETRAGDLEAKCVSADRIYPEWVPVVESYRTENAHIRVLAPGPDFAVPYAIVTYDDLSRMMEQAGWSLSRFNGVNAPGFDVFDRLPGGRLIALSAVGFDATKRRAMLVIQYNCFPSHQPGYDRNRGLCHSGNYAFLEKRDGKWVSGRPGIGGCGGWIA